MKLALASWSLLVLSACEGKLDTKESGSVSRPNAQATEATPEGAKSNAPATANFEVLAPEVIAGLWSSSCISDPNNTLRPGSIAQYQFGTSGEGNLKIISYKDDKCESRYTKTDVDQLRAQLKADALSSGLTPVSDSDLAGLDVLWMPPTSQYQFKLGRKYPNGLMELDLVFQGTQGPEPTVFTTFHFSEGLLYFAQTCSALDGLAGSCTPVSGDQLDRRAKTIDFRLGFEK